MNNHRVIPTKLLVILGLVIVFVLAAAGRVAAHVVIENEQSEAAIMHITPNDEPIAGPLSTIFFDVSNVDDYRNNNYRIFVSNTRGDEVQVRSYRSGSTVKGALVFRDKGSYEARLEVYRSGEGQPFNIYRYPVTVSRDETVTEKRADAELYWVIAAISGAFTVLFIGRTVQLIARMPAPKIRR